MNQRDQLKLLNAGFMIIRKDDQPSIRIKAKSSANHEFQTLEGNFKSKAERDRKMYELLKVNTIIED